MSHRMNIFLNGVNQKYIQDMLHVWENLALNLGYHIYAYTNSNTNYPVKGYPWIEPPPCWLHIWPGLILVLASGWFFPLTLSWVPLLFWAQHVVLDKFQRNDGSYANIPFWYPVKKKNWTPQGGYPVK